MAADQDRTAEDLTEELRGAHDTIRRLGQEALLRDAQFGRFQEEVRQWREEHAAATMATQQQHQTLTQPRGEVPGPQTDQAISGGHGVPTAEAVGTASRGQEQVLPGPDPLAALTAGLSGNGRSQDNGVARTGLNQTGSEPPTEGSRGEGHEMQAISSAVQDIQSQSVLVAESLQLSVQLQRSLLEKQRVNGAQRNAPGRAVFNRDLPSHKEVMPIDQLQALLDEPLKILPSHIDKLLTRADKYDMPALWNMKEQQAKMRADLGARSASISNETVFHVLRIVRAGVLLSADMEKALIDQDSDALALSILELRLAFGAIFSKVTHDLFNRSWLQKETAKKRASGQIMEDLAKMDVHLPYLVNEDLIQTATLLNQSGMVSGGSGAGGYSNRSHNGNSGGSSFGHTPKKKKWGEGRTTLPRDQRSYQQQPKWDGQGINPNFKGDPAKYIPGFKRPAAGAKQFNSNNASGGNGEKA